MLSRRIAVCVFLAASIGFNGHDSLGQDFPRRAIRIITGEPGGGSDIAARQIGQGLAATLGQPVIVENRGGSVVIQAEAAGKASPDGHTLLFTSTAFWLLPFIQENVPYDPLRDFAAITLATRAANVLVVHPSVAAKSVSELIALARKNPKGLNYGSTGTGSSAQLSAELFKSMADVNIVHVNYKGSAPALNDLIGGQTQIMFITLVVASPHIKSERLKALAVTGAQPSPLFPGLPTVAASGLPGYESAVLTGMFAPAGISVSTLGKLNREIVQVLNKADVKERQLNAGGEIVGSTAEGFAAVLKAEMSKWGKVIKDASISAR